jgi:hypothetical protein
MAPLLGILAAYLLAMALVWAWGHGSLPLAVLLAWTFLRHALLALSPGGPPDPE